MLIGENAVFSVFRLRCFQSFPPPDAAIECIISKGRGETTDSIWLERAVLFVCRHRAVL